MPHTGRPSIPIRERTVRLTVSIPMRLRQALRAAATADTRTVSNFLTLLIVEGLAARSRTQPRPTRNAPKEAE